MSETPSSIDVVAQSSRNLRISQIRGMNVLDGLVAVSTDYESADMVAVGSAEFSRALNVKGFDSVLLLVSHTEQTDGNSTSFDIQIQASFQQDVSADTYWYDRRVSFDLQFGNATAIPDTDVVTLDTSGLSGGDTHRFAIEIACLGHYMRFRPGITTGGSRAGSRCTIHAIRHQSSS